MRGPRPMPLERRQALGNPGKRGKPRPPDGGVSKVPPAPAALGEIGKREWKRLWTAGADWLDLGSEGGPAALPARLCEAYERRELYRAEVKKCSMVKGSTGQPIVNPAAGELRRIDNDILRMESALGFTPTDRARMGLKIKKPESKLDEFTKRRRQR